MTDEAPKELMISRRKLMDLAFAAISEYDGYVDDNDGGYSWKPLSPDDRKHLLYAACTMDYVALGDWWIDPQCGCLVGTMLHNEGSDPEPQTEPLIEIGFVFDRLLAIELDADGTQPVKVLG